MNINCTICGGIGIVGEDKKYDFCECIEKENEKMYFIIASYHYDIWEFQLEKYNDTMHKLLENLDLNIRLVVKGECLHKSMLSNKEDLIKLVEEIIKTTSYDSDKEDGKNLIDLLNN